MKGNSRKSWSDQDVKDCPTGEKGSAVKPLAISVPAVDYKAEAPETFFGGDTFDANAPIAYLSGLKVRAPIASLEPFASANA